MGFHANGMLVIMLHGHGAPMLEKVSAMLVKQEEIFEACRLKHCDATACQWTDTPY